MIAAIQIAVFGVCSPVMHQTPGIKAREYHDWYIAQYRAMEFGPLIESFRRSRFIAVDSCGQIDSASILERRRNEAEQLKLFRHAINRALQPSFPSQIFPAFVQKLIIVYPMLLELKIHAAANSVNKR